MESQAPVQYALECDGDGWREGHRYREGDEDAPGNGGRETVNPAGELIITDVALAASRIGPSYYRQVLARN